MLNYFQFITTNLFRKWSFYLTTLIYFILELLLLFLVPAIADASIPNILFYNGLWMLLVFTGGVNSGIIAIHLFRASIDDGTELLIISKPLRRSQIIWSKIILLIIVAILISIIALLFGLLSGVTWQSAGMFHLIGVGMFLGTFVTFMFFSAITVLSSLYLKKLGAILTTVGLGAIMMLYALIVSLVSTTPVATFKNKGYSIQSTALVKENPKTTNNKLNDNLLNLKYYWGGFATYQGKPITLQTKNINSELIIQNQDPLTFLTNEWKTDSQKANASQFSYSDLMFQLTSLFNLTMKKLFNQNLSSFSYLFNSESNFPFQLKISPYNINFNIEAAKLKQDGYLAYKLENVPDYIVYEQQSEQTSNPNHPIINGSKINQDLILVSKKTSAILVNNNIISGNITSNNSLYNGTSEVKIFNLPTFDLTTKQIIWPKQIYSTYNISKSNISDVDGLKNFLTTYYNNFYVNYINELITKNNLNFGSLPFSKKFKNPYEYLPTVFASLFFMRTIYQEQTNTYLNFNNLSRKAQEQSYQSFLNVWRNFQLLSLASLNSVAVNNNDILNYDDNSIIGSLVNLAKPLSVLNLSQSNNLKNGLNFVFIGDPNQFQDLLNDNAPQSQKELALSKIVPFANPWYFINPNQLTTFSSIEPVSFFNLSGLISAWLIISSLMLFLSFALYAKRDFS